MDGSGNDFCAGKFLIENRPAFSSAFRAYIFFFFASVMSNNGSLKFPCGVCPSEWRVTCRCRIQIERALYFDTCQKANDLKALLRAFRINPLRLEI